MQLNFIDIASWQAGIVPSSTPADGVIIKATGGVGYVNPYWREWADDVLASGKLLSLYHYANERGCSSTAAREAEFFLNEVSDYIGKFVPVLDWENDALMNPPSWCAEWFEIVAARTKAKPMFYGYASNVNSTDYSSIVVYPLWMASYLSRYDGSGFVTNPVNTWDTGDWPSMTMYQYTSTGRISGYNGPLDLSCFYGSRADFQALIGREKPQQPKSEPMNDAGLYYRAHVETSGWLPLVHDGMIAGTTGYYARLEALRVNPPANWALEIKIHMESIGWVKYRVAHNNDTIIGTVGEYRRIEMISICVVKRPKNDNRTLRFRVHEQDFGWLAWTNEGYASGSDGQYRRLEAIQIVIG